MRSLAHQRVSCRAVEHDEGVLRQVDPMDLLEELLPHAGICGGLFLGKQLVQAGVAIEVDIVADWRNLVTGNEPESSGS